MPQLPEHNPVQPASLAWPRATTAACGPALRAGIAVSAAARAAQLGSRELAAAARPPAVAAALEAASFDAPGAAACERLARDVPGFGHRELSGLAWAAAVAHFEHPPPMAAVGGASRAQMPWLGPQSPWNVARALATAAHCDRPAMEAPADAAAQAA
ncbi:unnamed protein product [Effrenium voratum]|nr:unnamed protein product [Effrenium voratum]